jgi:hypothetical protein
MRWIPISWGYFDSAASPQSIAMPESATIRPDHDDADGPITLDHFAEILTPIHPSHNTSDTGHAITMQQSLIETTYYAG